MGAKMPNPSTQGPKPQASPAPPTRRDAMASSIASMIEGLPPGPCVRVVYVPNESVAQLWVNVLAEIGEVFVNGREYVRKDSVKPPAEAPGGSYSVGPP